MDKISNINLIYNKKILLKKLNKISVTMIYIGVLIFWDCNKFYCLFIICNINIKQYKKYIDWEMRKI